VWAKFANHEKIDTPSLRFMGGTAPYFHDGRYRTLEELLADRESVMGHSASLPVGDRAALAAYLRSLGAPRPSSERGTEPPAIVDPPRAPGAAALQGLRIERPALPRPKAA
jgi:hypothetical protein